MKQKRTNKDKENRKKEDIEEKKLNTHEGELFTSFFHKIGMKKICEYTFSVLSKVI